MKRTAFMKRPAIVTLYCFFIGLMTNLSLYAQDSAGIDEAVAKNVSSKSDSTPLRAMPSTGATTSPVLPADLQKGSQQQEVPTASAKVNWLSFEEAVEKAKTAPKKVFIDVYTDWCGWCKVMDKKTFSEARIAKYLNENFYPVKLDGEYEEDIEFKGNTFKFVASGRRGYHQLAAALLKNKLSYPTVVFLDEDFNLIQPLPGYQKAPDFDRIIKYIGGDHFKDQSWKEFAKSYKSPFEDADE